MSIYLLILLSLCHDDLTLNVYVKDTRISSVGRTTDFRLTHLSITVFNTTTTLREAVIQFIFRRRTECDYSYRRKGAVIEGCVSLKSVVLRS